MSYNSNNKSSSATKPCLAFFLSLALVAFVPATALADVFSEKSVDSTKTADLIKRIDQLEKRFESVGPSGFSPNGMPGTFGSREEPTPEELGVKIKGTLNGYKIVASQGTTLILSPKEFKEFKKDAIARGGTPYMGPRGPMQPSLNLPPPPSPAGAKPLAAASGPSPVAAPIPTPPPKPGSTAEARQAAKANEPTAK